MNAQEEVKLLVSTPCYEAFIHSFRAITMFEPEENIEVIRDSFFTSILVAYTIGLAKGSREVEASQPVPPKVGRNERSN